MYVPTSGEMGAGHSSSKQAIPARWCTIYTQVDPLWAPKRTITHRKSQSRLSLLKVESYAKYS